MVIIGAGPAGLTAAYQLARRGVTSTVLEATDVVGGISRTVERDGWRFDIGGHRFFTKVQPVEELWHEILDEEDFLLTPRMSRIFYDGKYFDYPLKAINALRNLGLIEAVPAACCPTSGCASGRPKDQDELRGLGGVPLRVAPLPHVLQDLHREGLGHPRRRDARRLGRAADQEPVAVQRR